LFNPSKLFKGLWEQIKSSFTKVGAYSKEDTLLCKIIKLPPTSLGPPFNEKISFL
jgi:hypothetical protein